VQQPPAAAPAPPRLAPSAGICVLGVGDLLTNVASCCHPVPGDDIVGFVTRSRGVSVHRGDCLNVVNVEEKERLVKVEWAHTDQRYQVSVNVDAIDRLGLLRDVSGKVSDEKVNIAAVSINEHDDGIISLNLTLEISDVGQLSRLFSKLEGVRGVLNVSRKLDRATRGG
ncbi:ACT domain-containing protein, partial [Chloroflexota bacterium]